MKIFKWNIRNQILFLGGISLLVLFGVVAYFYNFTRDEFQSSSEKLIHVSSRQFADEIDRSFARSVGTFNDWTKDDVFGLAIEFSTTGELGSEFGKWLKAAPEFGLVALVDATGKVLECSSASSYSGSKGLKGVRLPELSAIKNQRKRQTALIESSTLAQLGAENKTSYIFYQPAFSSSETYNGAVVALLNWSEIDSHIGGCTEEFNVEGYSSARTVVVYPSMGAVSSNGNGVDLKPMSYDRLVKWAAKTNENTVASLDLDEGTMLVGWNGLNPPVLNTGNDVSAERPVMLSVIPEDEILARLRSELLIVLVLGSLGMVLVGFMTYFVARRISVRVSRAAELASGMAEGDTSREVDIQGNDEIGALGDAFKDLTTYLKDMSGVAQRIASNDLTVDVTPRSERDTLGNSFRSMVMNLTAMIRQLGDNSSQLVSAAGEIATSSEVMSRGAKEQTDQIGQVSTAIEEMAATILESSKNAGQVTEASQGAAENATTGGQIVNDTIQGMQRIASVVRESAESITKLANSADQIGEIISVIDDIADQTNLLALNAAIEAARAGEQGRGFAVVADEVRKLAERTGTATGEITGMIKGIQTDTEDAVNSMEAGIQEVDKGRELADKAGASLTEIVNMSQRVQEMITQIATATEEQSAAAEQISKNVESVSSIARESASGAEQSATAADELNRQAENLKVMVAKFKLEQD